MLKSWANKNQIPLQTIYRRIGWKRRAVLYMKKQPDLKISVLIRMAHAVAAPLDLFLQEIGLQYQSRYMRVLRASRPLQRCIVCSSGDHDVTTCPRALSPEVSVEFLKADMRSRRKG